MVFDAREQAASPVTAQIRHTTDSGHALPVSANVLARRFDPSGPNQAGVSDITYIRTRSGRLYLAVGLDLTPGAAGAPRIGPQHEPQGKLLRQRRDTTLPPDPQDGVGLAARLRKPRRGNDRTRFSIWRRTRSAQTSLG